MSTEQVSAASSSKIHAESQRNYASAKRKKIAKPSGKKGKKFLEDKSQLLSLVDGITSTKDSAARAKVDKLRALSTERRPPSGEILMGKRKREDSRGGSAIAEPAGPDIMSIDHKSPRSEAKNANAPVAGRERLSKKQANEQALQAAKAAILERDREKKLLKKQAKRVRNGIHEDGGAVETSPHEGGHPGSETTTRKKRVGFA